MPRIDVYPKTVVKRCKYCQGTVSMMVKNKKDKLLAYYCCDEHAWLYLKDAMPNLDCAKAQYKRYLSRNVWRDKGAVKPNPRKDRLPLAEEKRQKRIEEKERLKTIAARDVEYWKALRLHRGLSV